MKYFDIFIKLIKGECILVKNIKSQRFFTIKEPDLYPGFAKFVNCDNQINHINEQIITKEEYESEWQIIK